MFIYLPNFYPTFSVWTILQVVTVKYKYKAIKCSSLWVLSDNSNKVLMGAWMFPGLPLWAKCPGHFRCHWGTKPDSNFQREGEASLEASPRPLVCSPVPGSLYTVNWAELGCSHCMMGELDFYSSADIQWTKRSDWLQLHALHLLKCCLVKKYKLKSQESFRKLGTLLQLVSSRVIWIRYSLGFKVI